MSVQQDCSDLFIRVIGDGEKDTSPELFFRFYITEYEHGGNYDINESEPRTVMKDFPINDLNNFLNNEMGSCVLSMLSFADFLLPQTLHYLVQQITPFAHDEVEAVSQTKPETILVSVRITVFTKHWVEEEEEVESRVLQESMELYEELELVKVPASKDSIEALETMKFEIEGKSEVQCMVCLEDFSIGTEVTKMPCFHAFHGECIVQWLELSNLCPLCRFEMPTD